MYTVPGPVNLHTRPSPELIPLMRPPDATRSRTYLQFHATRWPLSMMYRSFSTNYDRDVVSKIHLQACEEFVGALRSVLLS